MMMMMAMMIFMKCTRYINASWILFKGYKQKFIASQVRRKQVVFAFDQDRICGKAIPIWGCIKRGRYSSNIYALSNFRAVLYFFCHKKTVVDFYFILYLM